MLVLPCSKVTLTSDGTANITGTLNIAGNPAATAGDITALAIALG